MKVVFDPKYVSDETITGLQSAVRHINEIAVGMTFIADVFHDDPGHNKLSEETFSLGIETLIAHQENIEGPLIKLGEAIAALTKSKKWMEPSAYAGESRPQRRPDDKAAEAEATDE
jgi:hypothetical protein